MRDPNGADTATSKPSNPKDAAALWKRIAFSVIPFRVLAGLALALAEGAWKYGRHNYRPAGVLVMVYIDATLRHLFAYAEGQDIDPASGFHHVDKAMASLCVLRDGLYQGNVVDDRPPAVAGDWIAEANASYEALGQRMAEMHGEPRAPFTEVERKEVAFLESQLSAVSAQSLEVQRASGRTDCLGPHCDGRCSLPASDCAHRTVG
jgi:hypothetical protein